MGQIYKNAVCNIVAAESFDPHVGLYRRRDSANFRPQKVHITWDLDTKVQRNNYTDYELIRGDFYIMQSNFENHFTLDSAINKRAWVTQERLLASTILQFGKDQVSFQSEDLSACEVFPHGYPHHNRTLSTNPLRRSSGYRQIAEKYRRQYFGDVSTGTVRADQVDDLLSTWNDIVGSYSQCVLTRQSDRLIAISGLVSLFQERLPEDSYTAGLWSSQLPVSTFPSLRAHNKCLCRPRIINHSLYDTCSAYRFHLLCI